MQRIGTKEEADVVGVHECRSRHRPTSQARGPLIDSRVSRRPVVLMYTQGQLMLVCVQGETKRRRPSIRVPTL